MSDPSPPISNPPPKYSSDPTSVLTNWIPPFPSDQSWPVPVTDYQSAGLQYLWSTYFREYIPVSSDQWNVSLQATAASSGKDSLSATVIDLPDPNIDSLTNQQYHTNMCAAILGKWYNALPTLMPVNAACPSDTPNCDNNPTTAVSGPRPPSGVSVSNYQEWLTQASPNSWYLNEPEDMKAKFRLFLDRESVTLRGRDSFLWLYTQLMHLYKNMQETVVGQSTRVNALITAQESATTALSQAISRFKDPTEASDVSTPVKNQTVLTQIQVYQGNATFIGAKISSVNNAVSTAQSNEKEIGTLMSSMVSQLQKLFNSLFT